MLAALTRTSRLASRPLLPSAVASVLPASVGAPLVQSRSMSIHKLTRMSVIDNSGARELMVIDHFVRAPAGLGDAVRAVVKSARPDGRVSRKEIVAAVVVRQRSRHTRRDGSTVRFQENAAVLMKRDLSGPLGTRVTGPVARELRAGKFMKVVMMASGVV
tara:strand:+ start:6411 stop:6890 length:480 start_codon:yes stop_codon:yes gene_type:complete